MQRGPARVRSANCGAGEVPLDGLGNRSERGALWTGSARRRHETGTNVALDLLPGFGLRPDMLGFEFIEHQVARFQLLVMTGDAILIDEGAMLRGGWLLPVSLAQRHCGKCQKDRARN